MKNLLIFFSGTGKVIDSIAQSCYDGINHNIAKITHTVSDQRHPPGISIVQKWKLICVSIPFCERFDTWSTWNHRIINNSLLKSKPDLIILADFFPRIEFPQTYNTISINENDDPTIYCELIKNLLSS